MLDTEISGNLTLLSTITDSNSSVGTSGQMLSSTGSKVENGLMHLGFSGNYLEYTNCSRKCKQC
jgi:hypothetical protein